MELPATLKYLSVVARNFVRISCILLELYRLDILSTNIGNAYLNALCWENIWFTYGAEFGIRKGTNVVVVKYLYNLKISVDT